MIPIGDIGNTSQKGLSCKFDRDSNQEGVWEDPSGYSVIQTGTSGGRNLPVFYQERPGRVLLIRGGVEFSSSDEGIYTCRVVEDGVEETLHVGVYTRSTFDNSGMSTPFLPMTAQV